MDDVGEGVALQPAPANGLYARRSGPVNGSTSGSGSSGRTPIGDDWELDCEICHRRGINQVSLTGS